MTNFEKIKSMNIDDLGDLITKISNNEINIESEVCQKCRYKIDGDCPSRTDCIFKDEYTGLLWLIKEV